MKIASHDSDDQEQRPSLRSHDELPPAATPRMELPSITDFIDQAMERMPESAVLNMADPQQRNRLRSWMTTLLESFLRETVWSFQKGADRGIEQIAHLIEDPSYYRTISERRRRNRERSRQQMEESRQSAIRWRQEEAIALKAEIDSGKVRLLNTRLDVSALPDDQRGPHDPPSA